MDECLYLDSILFIFWAPFVRLACSYTYVWALSKKISPFTLFGISAAGRWTVDGGLSSAVGCRDHWIRLWVGGCLGAGLIYGCTSGQEKELVVCCYFFVDFQLVEEASLESTILEPGKLGGNND